MSRQRIKMNLDLFSRLIAHAEARGEAVLVPDASRYIRRSDDADADLMSRATALPIVVTRQMRLVRISHGADVYFCFFGVPEPEVPLGGLDLVVATPGLFTVSVLEAGVTPSRSMTSASIKDVLDGASMQEDPSYSGHELDQIQALFPQILSYKACGDFEYLSNPDRVLGSMIAKTYLDGPVTIDPDTSNAFVDLFESGSNLVPYRNLIQALLSISWEHLFIEIYRCIEQLYAWPRVKKLKEAISCPSSMRDLAAALEDHLSWYPKEEEAFKALVRLCDERTISSLYGGLRCTGASEHLARCDSVAREIYKLRNRIVHYRPAHDVISKTDEDWNIIVRETLKIVSFLYEECGQSFFQADPAVVGVVSS